MIYIAKPFLPDINKYKRYVELIYKSSQVTNGGPLRQELTDRLKEYLNVENLLLVASGSAALQISYAALRIKTDRSEVVTSPFTFIATASTLKWEGIQPIFSDVRKETLCLDPNLVSEKITNRTTAILPVHVYGNICAVEHLSDLGRKKNLKIVYDASHAFGVNIDGRGIMAFGDASIVSFHATKLFHTIEGGAISFRREEDLEFAEKLSNFGMAKDGQVTELGINTKLNEFQAAMGLCVLDDIDQIFSERSAVAAEYDRGLSNWVSFPQSETKCNKNNAYYPIILENSASADKVLRDLSNEGIFAKKYFHPSLNTLDVFSPANTCPISEDYSTRVVCLPIFPSLKRRYVHRIVKIVKDAL